MKIGNCLIFSNCFFECSLIFPGIPPIIPDRRPVDRRFQGSEGRRFEIWPLNTNHDFYIGDKLLKCKLMGAFCDRGENILKAIKNPPKNTKSY